MNINILGRKRMDEMLERGWRIQLQEFGETAEETRNRLLKSYKQVKIYYVTTCVKGYYDTIALVKR